MHKVLLLIWKGVGRSPSKSLEKARNKKAMQSEGKQMADLGGETSTFTNPNLNCTVEGLVQTRIDQSKERESNTRSLGKDLVTLIPFDWDQMNP